MKKSVIYLLAFSGGFTVMSIELLGGRIMSPYFGSSIYVWGSVITVFMLSLSLGYLAGGRLSLANPSLTRFGLIFLGGGVAMVPLILTGDLVMDWVFLRIEDPRYGSLAASSFLFVVPTIVLGMIAPYSVRLLVREAHTSGHVAGTLYFVSTLGSALGTLATSFYLVLWLEVNTILFVLVATMLLMGALAVMADRWI
ncbi:MAG: fused MFS/spermidine synthase [Gammaproteobacteria bacterium]|nr:fused MFS/spermidine synthase [Gammaproteobacteria bacterium]